MLPCHLTSPVEPWFFHAQRAIFVFKGYLIHLTRAPAHRDEPEHQPSATVSDQLECRVKTQLTLPAITSYETARDKLEMMELLV
jgi:hypothetical protein